MKDVLTVGLYIVDLQQCLYSVLQRVYSIVMVGIAYG